MKTSPRPLVGPASVTIAVGPDSIAHVRYEARFSHGIQERVRLYWRAPELERLNTWCPDGTRPVVAHVRDRVMVDVILPRVPDDELKVRIEYRFRMERMADDLPIYKVALWNLPRVIPSDGKSRVEGSSSPWIEEPELYVRLTPSDPRWRAMGPRGFQGDAVPDLAAHHAVGRTFFLVGRFVSVGRSERVEVLTPVGFSAVSSDQVAQTASVADKVLEELELLFGHPAIRPPDTIVLYPGHGGGSYCLGSALLIDHSEIADAPGPADTRARILALVAHESAHSWFLFGSYWSDDEARPVIQEALAQFLQFALVVRIGGEASSDIVDDWELWRLLRSALAHNDQKLRKRGQSAAGLSASLFLRFGRTNLGLDIEFALQRLWDLGKSKLLEIGDLYRVFAQSLNQAFAEALVAAIHRPRPIVAKARVTFDKADKQWRLVLKPRQRDLQALRRKLEAVALPLDFDVHRPRITVPVASSANVGVSYSNMFPYLLVSKRFERKTLLTLHRRRTRLWRWIESLTVDGVHARRPTARVFLAGLIALALNDEDPLGFLLMAQVARVRSSRLHGRFRSLAAARAASFGEEEIREWLSEDISHV